MKKFILTKVIFLTVFGASFAQVLYTENFNQAVASGDYYWSWHDASNPTISNINKVSSGELQMTLTGAGGTGVDNNAIYFTLYGNSGDTLIDMSSHKTITFTMKSTVNVTVRLDVRSDSNDVYATDKYPVTQNLVGDGSYHILTFDFNNKFINWQNNLVDSTEIHSLVLNFNRNVSPAATGTVTFDQFKIGQVVTGINKATQNIASSCLFPNPSSGNTNINLTLKETAKVKVVLTNALGQEVQVIADKTANVLNESFNVSGFAQGMYNVTYYLDGAPAKSELLMVK
jgi:hypothetical protein